MILGLPHPLGHIADGGRLIPDQTALGRRLAVIERISHHLTQRIGAAHTIGINENTASLNDDPVLGTQITAGVMDIFRPFGDGVILAPFVAVAVFAQTAQQIQEGVIGLIHLIKIAGGHRLGIGAPHRGIIAVDPAGGPRRAVAVEHLLLLLVGDSGLFLEFIGGSDPPLVVAAGGVIGVDAASAACHHLGGVRAFTVVLHGIGIKPGDLAPALFGGPGFIGALAPYDVKGCTDYMPGGIVTVADVPHHALRELDQRKPEESPLGVGGPVNIGGGGLLTAGATRVKAAGAAGGIRAGNHDGGAFDTSPAQLGQCRIGNNAVSPVNGIVTLGIYSGLAGIAALCHDLSHVGVVEVPPLAAERNQAGRCAVALEALGPLGGGELLRPILQAAGHGVGAGRLLEADRLRTQLVHPGGHIVLGPVLIFLINRAIQRVLKQLVGVALGKAHIHGQPGLMVGGAVGDEPALAAGIAHSDGLVHIGGYSAVAVPQGAEAIAHSGLHPGGPEGLVDHQGLTVGHGGLLHLCQTLGQCEHTGNHILIAAQSGAELLRVVKLLSSHIRDVPAVHGLEDAALAVGQVVGDTGHDVGQVDKDVLLIYPAGLSDLAAFPASHTAAVVNGKTDLDPIAAAVLQKGEGDGFGSV